MFTLFGLLVTVLDVIALVSLLKSGADTATKILWALLIVLLPLLGMAARNRPRSRGAWGRVALRWWRGISPSCSDVENPEE